MHSRRSGIAPGGSQHDPWDDAGGLRPPIILGNWLAAPASPGAGGIPPSRYPYDVAAARLTLARIAGEQRRCAEVTHADQARSAIESGGYRVLYRLFPAQDIPPGTHCPWRYPGSVRGPGARGSHRGI
jgi:hypothetical protein